MPVFLLSPKVVVSEAKKASEAKKGGGEEEQEEEYAYVRLKPVKASKSVFLQNFERKFNPGAPQPSGAATRSYWSG